MYLNIQFTQAMFQQYKTQDSLFTILMDAARRQYAAGQIDYVSHTLTASSQGEIQNQKMQAETDWYISMKQMNRITGNQTDFLVTPITRRNSGYTLEEPVVFMAVNNSDLKLAEQEIQIHKKSLELEKHKILPGFSIAYMNQGSHGTPDYLRWRAGISLPIWFWQYDASIKAAKTKVEISKYQSDQLIQQIENQASQLLSNIQKYHESLEYFEKTGLPLAKELITSATRMFDAGLYDYMSYLRLLSEAYKIEQKYLETLLQFNQTVIDMEFLNE
jgi:outer membrane protein, heavy metal efflux system